MNHRELEPGYHGIGPRRTARPGQRDDPMRASDLASARHVAGDISEAEIDRRFYAALAEIKWRRQHGLS